MHRCLERLQRVIESTAYLDYSYQPPKNSEEYGSLKIIDRLFGNRVLTAEIVEPYWILISIRITPSMQDKDEATLGRIFDFILSMANPYGLNVPYDDEKKICAVGGRFSCIGDYTEMEQNFERNLDDIRQFVDDNNGALRSFLRNNGIFFD